MRAPTGLVVVTLHDAQVKGRRRLGYSSLSLRGVALGPAGANPHLLHGRVVGRSSGEVHAAVEACGGVRYTNTVTFSTAAVCIAPKPAVSIGLSFDANWTVSIVLVFKAKPTVSIALSFHVNAKPKLLASAKLREGRVCSDPEKVLSYSNLRNRRK